MGTLKTMTVADGYVLKTSDYPTIPKRAGYTGSWPKTGAIHANTTITVSTRKIAESSSHRSRPAPARSCPAGEGEPVEADVPAEDETVAPQGMHVTGTQTVTHEYLTLNGKVARETIRTNNTLTAVLDFIYDESGKPFALKYSTNGTSFQTYYYVLNLQGDVVKLIHYIPGFEYESVATYEYDAWGNMCPAPVDWLRSTRSGIADTIMIMRRGSITCSLVIMILQTGDLLMPLIRACQNRSRVIILFMCYTIHRIMRT